MIDLNKIFPVSRIETGIYVIVGRTGGGKTSLGVGKLSRDYKKYGHQRFLESLALVERLRPNGYPNLRLDHNLYFCANFALLDKGKGVPCWQVDFTKLGFPNEQYEVQNLPYGAVVFIPECDQVCNARDTQGKGLNEFLRGFLKYHRHNKITLILDMQDFSRLNNEFRHLVHNVIYVKKKTSLILFGHTLLTIWKLIVFDISYLNLVASLNSLNIEVSEKSYLSKDRFIFFGDVHKYYENQSGLPYFLQKVDHYDYIESKPLELSREAIDEYVKSHPVVMPEEFKKQTKKLDKVEMSEDIKKKITELTKDFKNYLWESFGKGEKK